MSRAIGDVYVVTQLGLLPRRCEYFYNTIFPVLRSVEKVMRIYLVAPTRWTDQVLLWDRKRDAQNTIGNTDGETTPNPAHLPPSTPMSYVPPLVFAGTGAIGVGLAATGALEGPINGLNSLIAPAVQIFTGDKKDKDPAVEPLQFPLKTDVLLPSSDDKAGTNGELLTASTDGTSEPQTGETSSTGETSRTDSASGETSAMDTAADGISKTDDQISYNGDLSVRNLFQRRRRALFPRQMESCSVQPTASDFVPDGPDPNTAPSAPDSYVLAKLGVNLDTATILITQHDEVPPNEYFVLDISVFANPQDNPISDVQGVQASPGQKITVEVPWKVDDPPPDSLITLATFTWPLYVYVDSEREKPIRFEYGDPLMFGSGEQLEWGF